MYGHMVCAIELLNSQNPEIVRIGFGGNGMMSNRSGTHPIARTSVSTFITTTLSQKMKNYFA